LGSSTPTRSSGRVMRATMRPSANAIFSRSPYEYSICFMSSTSRRLRPWISAASHSAPNSVCCGREAKIISCISRRIASPARRRRSFALPASGIAIFVVGSTVIAMRGNSDFG
jgi:hypothetical protein